MTLRLCWQHPPQLQTCEVVWGIRRSLGARLGQTNASATLRVGPELLRQPARPSSSKSVHSAPRPNVSTDMAAAQEGQRTCEQQQVKVLIVGAGMAGLGAARALADLSSTGPVQYQVVNGHQLKVLSVLMRCVGSPTCLCTGDAAGS